MDKNTINTLLHKQKKEYTDMLINNILPYWMDKTDQESGGFYTCYNVYGDQLISRDKYVWSQGRCAWLYSRLSQDYHIPLPEKTRKKCLELAQEGSAFLENHCLLPDGKAAFVLDENNIPRTIEPYGSKAISSFSDCFTAIGLAAAGEAAKNRRLLLKAYELLINTARELQDGTFQTAPDILPDGWRSQASYMIMIQSSYEAAKAMMPFGMIKEIRRLQEICRFSMRMELTHFLTKDHLLLECLDHDFLPLDSLYGRHINPGHSVECAWFLIEASRWLGMPEVEACAVEIIKRSSSLAWDESYGGMFYYLDRYGGIPKGSYLEAEQPLAAAALRDWSNKMWWPHLEAVYANLLAFLYQGDKTCWIEYERYRHYAFHTFPNPDCTVGEWIQIRNRKGAPLTEAVGGRLPVKDPYHLIRTLMNLIDLIEVYAR